MFSCSFPTWTCLRYEIRREIVTLSPEFGAITREFNLTATCSPRNAIRRHPCSTDFRSSKRTWEVESRKCGNSLPKGFRHIDVVFLKEFPSSRENVRGNVLKVRPRIILTHTRHCRLPQSQIRISDSSYIRAFSFRMQVNKSPRYSRLSIRDYSDNKGDGFASAFPTFAQFLS